MRAILANRHIRRVSGYPAQAIKAVTLRQGARTDLEAASHLPPIGDAFTVADAGGTPYVLHFNSRQPSLPGP